MGPMMEPMKIPNIISSLLHTRMYCLSLSIVVVEGIKMTYLYRDFYEYPIQVVSILKTLY